jgi:mannose-1-phosphate guanylyltransferase
MNVDKPDPWAIILAGGDGLRLRSLTQKIAGDLRPKQFCALVDGETMFDRTRRRAALLVRPDRQVAVVTDEHRAYFAPLSSDLAPGCLVVQPSNQGTLAGIVYSVMRVEHLAGDVPIAILPSDHDVMDDGAFMTYVASAVDLVRALPDRLVLLGIEAETPETEYGWVEPSRLPLPLDGPAVFPVRRFWEKPSPTLARVLLERRCLWNSFVTVGWASAFMDCVNATVPEALVTFAPLRRALGTPEEEGVASLVYANLAPLSFSARVLAHVPDRLLAVRVKDVGWSDWGHPARVLAALRRTGRQPKWLKPDGLATTA